MPPSKLHDSLRETSQKVEASLRGSIEEYINSKDFQSGLDGLDFLDTKNSLLLSYLIELTASLRRSFLLKKQKKKNTQSQHADDRKEPIDNEEDQNALMVADTASLRRLTEMKVCLDKMRGLDKKLRYMIDKLLAAGTTATTFASAGGATTEGGEEDPLQFRPSTSALDDDDVDEEASSSSDSDEDLPGRKKTGDDHGDDDMDDDLEAARMTLKLAKGAKKSSNKGAEDDDDGTGGNAGVYRAPRLTAVPYTHDQEDREAEREKRQRRRMRASEVAMTLRNQYGEAPEQDDMHGGSELGKQRQAARRMAEQQDEKTKYEEDNFIRLTTTRKERKARDRLMRQETSNLGAISDLGNIIRESEEFSSSPRRIKKDKRRAGGSYNNDAGMEQSSDRHVNGKRKKQYDGGKHSSKTIKSKNSLQAALYGGGSGGNESGGAKSKRRKR